MADEVDIANAQAEVRREAALSRIERTMPAGAPGICDECEEPMPRLVGGLCGFCRDGRSPPLSFYADRPEAPASEPQEEEKSMPKEAVKTISIAVSGATLAMMETLATERGIALHRAAVALIQEALDEPAEEATVIIEPASVARLPTADLLAELARRFEAAVTPDLLDAAVTRAEAAEGQLAVIRGVLEQVRPQG